MMHPAVSARMVDGCAVERRYRYTVQNAGLLRPPPWPAARRRAGLQLRRRPMPVEHTRRFPLEPAPIHVPDEVLADLRRRLELTRWPDDAGNQDWHYGVDRAYLQELVDYWRTGYDWRKAEAAINAYEHYRVEVEGVPVHLMRRPGVARARSRSS
jgi:Epoxide hydrolase N terminus